MKAAQISEYGHADVIEISDIAKPTLGEEQVLVEVHAASINPFDTIVREGHVAQMVKSLPVTLGGDIAGVVSEVGSGVTNFSVGDKIYGQANAVAGNSGAFAEFAATAANQIGSMPTNLSFVEAGAIPLTGESALQVITGHMKLAPGQKILIHGGAGGIGTVAIQIAKHLGAYVATTATGDGVQYVTDLGADEVIDYASRQFEDVVHDYDAVFDTVGGDTYARSFNVLKKGGIIVSMVEQENTELAQQHEVVAVHQFTQVTTESLNELSKFIEDGIVTVHVDKTYPLEQIRQAFEDRESGTVRGKVAIEIKR
ncbi:MAG TPA: NADP-dependent oxidoreductase [Candidatus Saccharimonadales bacterium]|nr:NADP-dependent oxidoreductase [Candidatus Saccharimonadales bacterium]